MQSRAITYLLAAYLVVALAPPAPAWAPMPDPATQQALAIRPLPTAPPEPRAEIPHRDEIVAPVTKDQFRCLALTVYWEAGQEPFDGRLAVAHVVLNRVGQPGFAPTICGVVEQGGPQFPCQFHWYCGRTDTRPTNKVMWEEAEQAARQALAERDPTDGAQFFHQAALKTNWARKRYGVRVIGRHVFFRGRP